MAILYDEDIEEIGHSIGILVNNPQLDRLDIKLHETTALIYWTGNVLRVDLKGLDRK